ncbi:hypothetical protein Droror1_Dr00001139 [Drosera rotundifolia]
MGVMSRRVVPVCGNLCCICPSLRARSRQPVKRYKTLLAEIFPKAQDAEPNDRKIGKLCDYASKNPLRIPKITENLEQRFYKDLRNEHIGSVKVVLAVYRKLLSSCKKQMPLIATSLLGITQTLLDQTQETEIQVLGCHVLVDFINSQVDTAYMLNLEGFIPKLCQLTQEVGTDDKVLCLRTAGLQALASLVSFMGKHSHVSANFDKIIVVTLENYMEHGTEPGNGDLNGRPFQLNSLEDSIKSSRNGMDIKQEPAALVDTSKSPSYWSRVCLHNMVELAKEATTMRRVLEPFFQIFDSEDNWSQNGLACSVLMYLQSMLEEAGESSHFLLSIMTKHLENKNIVKQPQKQINIIKVTTQLANTANQQVSVALTGALIDLVKHLRKCIQSSLEISNTASGTETLNADLQSSIEDCISQMSCKVGDVGPILDMMAVVLDNLPSSAIVARATMFSVYRVTQIIMSLPNMPYHEDAFPDALFHQLLLAMAHSDSETRVGANYCFSLVLVPSPSCPWLCRTLPTCINSLGSSSILPLLRARTRSLTIPDDSQDKTEALDSQSLTESSSFKSDVTKGSKDRTSLRLSGHQISLLLSSIWVQALSTENNPANLIAIAHTYNIVLTFAWPKTTDHMALIKCFQLAFSLRSISLDEERVPCRSSLFTLASYMLMFSARAADLPELIPVVKSSMADNKIDPHLKLLEDVRLQAIDAEACGAMDALESVEDDSAMSKRLCVTNPDDNQLKEIVISHLLSKFEYLSEDELDGIRKQLLQGFLPDDSYPLTTQVFMETPKPGTPPVRTDIIPLDEMLNPPLMEEPAFVEDIVDQSDGKASLSVNPLDILSVNELLDSVLETARQVASLPVSTTPLPYDQVRNQCEALVTGKQHKMSVIHSVKRRQKTQAIVVVDDIEEEISLPITVTNDSEDDPKPISNGLVRGSNHALLSSLQYGLQNSFRLPPASPYDKFLEAAGS